jgi:hypothetical protein
MTSWDYYVGFVKEPKNLDGFLNKQGYERNHNEKDDSYKNYESKEGGLVDLFYSFKATEVKEGEVPDWKRSGYKVVSELMISTKDSDCAEEALKLAEATVKKYKSILYDSLAEEYFRKEEL